MNVFVDKVRRWSNKCWEALSNNSDSWCFGGPVVLWESVADPPVCKSRVWRWITWTNVISSASVLLESASVTGECEDVVDIPAVTYGFTAPSVLTQYWIYSPPQIQCRCFMISGFIGDVVGQYHISPLTLHEALIDFSTAVLVWVGEGLQVRLRTCCNLLWFDFYLINRIHERWLSTSPGSDQALWWKNKK